MKTDHMPQRNKILTKSKILTSEQRNAAENRILPIKTGFKLGEIQPTIASFKIKHETRGCISRHAPQHFDRAKVNGAGDGSKVAKLEKDAMNFKCDPEVHPKLRCAADTGSFGYGNSTQASP